MIAETTSPPVIPIQHDWGGLPERLRVLYLGSARRPAGWLSDALAADRVTAVALEECRTAADAALRLGDQFFDAVILIHAPPELDAIDVCGGLRGGGCEEALLILGEHPECELAPLALEARADEYLNAELATTRQLLWRLARAVERCKLVRENRRLLQAERTRLSHERVEAERLLAEQREMLAAACPALAAANEFAPALRENYQQLLRAHVMMGSGGLALEIHALAGALAAAGVTAASALGLHLDVLEELIRGLGNRSARHVMTRASLMAVELAMTLADQSSSRGVSPARKPRRRTPRRAAS